VFRTNNTTEKIDPARVSGKQPLQGDGKRRLVFFWRSKYLSDYQIFKNISVHEQENDQM
jgi:hypothetical protein